MRRRMLFLVSGLLVGTTLAQAPALAAQDLDCADFPNQEAAQREFDKYDTDIHGLDRDGDRIACEWVNVGGGVQIEDKVDAGKLAVFRGVVGVTYGSPSGARAEPRAPIAQDVAGVVAPRAGRPAGTGRSGDPGTAGRTARGWKAETVDSSNEVDQTAMAGGATPDATGSLQDPAAGDGAPMEMGTEALPHTGPRDPSLALLAMSMLTGGAALLRKTAYRPRRLAADR